MAKKFVRGITDIKTINNQDFDTNNVNDLLSDGEHNYIHRKKKDKSEEYHNLTDNIKTISSSNTDLIEVTNNNTTNNTATLKPKHDAHKEQVLESTRGTITIEHGANASSETTKVDTNPEKVLEHENLKTGDGLKVEHNANTSLVTISSKLKPAYTNVDMLPEGIAYGGNLTNAYLNDRTNSANYITLKFDENKFIQLYMRESGLTTNLIVSAYRFVKDNVATPWKSMSIDTDSLNSQLETKQNKLTNNTSIGVAGTGLRQLYTLKEKYTDNGGVLKTHVKIVSVNTNLNTAEEEFNFIVKLNKGVSSVNFTLNEHNKTKFSNIITTYGTDNTVCINGCVFTLSGSTLTVSTTNNTNQNYVITFSDII